MRAGGEDHWERFLPNLTAGTEGGGGTWRDDSDSWCAAKIYQEALTRGANGPAPGQIRGAVPSGGVPPAGGTAGPVGIQGDKPSDYQLTPARIAAIINRTDMPRFADNVAALRLLADLQAAHRYADAGGTGRPRERTWAGARPSSRSTHREPAGNPRGEREAALGQLVGE